MTAPKLLIVLLLAAGCVDAQAGDVLTGIDVLVRDEFEPLSGARVGLITNHTGVARDGRSTIHILHEAKNVNLVRIFSPEHGIEGKLDIPVIGDSTESGLGIPVVSLYGDVRRPTAAMLEDIDTIVFDIQDIGTRFYTYVSTMGNGMLAASEHGIRFVILDRPNPINGIRVAGPVLDEDLQSFVGFHRIPIQHGMTVGELAQLFAAELELGIDLEIVRMHGWQRSDFFDDTRLTWVNPSPNMRSLTAALLYPGIGLLETTNVSVGRGTATPFEVFGAPWLDGEAFAQSLNAQGLPGVSFEAVEFTPDASKYAHEVCGGVRVTVTNRGVFEAVPIGLEIARQLLIDYPDAWQTERYIRLLGNADTLRALLRGDDADSIRAGYQTELSAFRERRAVYLLYD